MGEVVKPDEWALLVVDDNEDNRYTLTRRLARQGYTSVATVNDGHQALELLRSRPFDLVLLDIMMPGLNGYQVLEHLKADAELRHLPVIMISAVEELESVIRCIELGAEDYLPKPFNATLLRARVGASLEKKRLRDEVRAALRRLERELEAARSLQLGMLPQDFPEWSKSRPVQLHALMEPAREVGGDLYDFFFAPAHRLCFLVGDVSGKGAPAAMFMARTRSLVRMAVALFQPTGAEEVSPRRIAEAVNRELCQDNRERMFVTLFLGFLDMNTGVLAYLNAGHPAPRVLRSAGKVFALEDKPQVPLGVRADAAYQNHKLALEPGDAIFVCSDGIPEAMNGNSDFYTEAHLDANLRAFWRAAPAAIIAAIKEDVDRFTEGCPKADDITMLALRWQTEPPA